ncbi:MAG: sugar ABC transporter permease [Actinomycetota bacterium]
MRLAAAEKRRTLLLLIPFLTGVVLLVVLPFAATAVLAFTEYDLVRPPRFVGMDNLRALLDDDVFRIALRNSLLFAAASVPLRLIGATGLALLLRRPGPGVRSGRIAVVLPVAIPDVALALVWLWILNPLYGPLNLALDAVGLPTPSWRSEAVPAQWSVIGLSVLQLGEGFLLALAARASVPRVLEEIAAVEGAGPWTTFRRVVFPVMLPALLLLAIRDTVWSFQATFVPALLVTDGGPPPYATTTLPLLAYRNAFEYLRYGYASAITLVLFALTASVVWLEIRLIARWRRTLRWN